MRFFKHKRENNNPRDQTTNAAGGEHHPQFPNQIMQEGHAMLEDIGPKLVAKINLGGSGGSNHFVDLFEHDLLTFGIDEKDVRILSALHLDVSWGFKSQSQFPGSE